MINILAVSQMCIRNINDHNHFHGMFQLCIGNINDHNHFA